MRTPLPNDGRRLVGKYITVGTMMPIWRVNQFDGRTQSFHVTSLSEAASSSRISFDELRKGYEEGLVNFGQEPRRQRGRQSEGATASTR